MSILKIIKKKYPPDDIGEFLEDISNELDISYTNNILHSGSYGLCRRGTISTRKVIVKVYREDIFSFDFLSEISLLNTVSGLGLYPDLLYIVSSIDGGCIAIVISDVGQVLLTKSLMKMKLTKISMENIASDFFIGYIYLYKNGIIHRDIKYNNVCLDNQLISIIDFGYGLRAPYFSTTYEISQINRNVDYYIEHCRDYIRTIDYLSIFNILYQIFGSEIDIKIFNENDIIKKRLYFLLTQNKSNRQSIINYLKKKGNLDYMLLSNNDYYIDCHRPEWILDYQRVKNNSGVFFSVMKKLININPKTRPTVNQLIRYLESKLNTVFYHKKKINSSISYNKILFVDNPKRVNFNSYFVNHMPIEIYARTYYRYSQLCNEYNLKLIPNLFEVIKYIVHCTSHENIMPVGIKPADLLNFISITNTDLLYHDPFRYYNLMWTINKSNTNFILFNYFLIIFSNSSIVTHVSPYYLALVISVIIYRIYHKFDLVAIKDNTSVYLPGKKFFRIPLGKSVLSALVLDNQFMSIVNSLFGFYSQLIQSGSLLALNRYVTHMYPNTSHAIKFYKKYLKID